MVGALTNHHIRNCPPYARITIRRGSASLRTLTLDELPFLPTGLFKRLDLRSVPTADIIRTLTSSGTSRASKSRIFLNNRTATAQIARAGDDHSGLYWHQAVANAGDRCPAGCRWSINRE